jgi:hypothetical protein
VLRSDFGRRRPPLPAVIRGARAVAGQALRGVVPHARLHPVLVNGAAGVVVTVDGRPLVLMGFLVAGGRMVEIDAIADAERVRRLAAAVLTRG